MMTANDFFYMSLGFGFLVMVACLVCLTVQFFRILQDVKNVTGNVSEITTDVATIKDGIKMALLKVVEKVLNKNRKGGEASHESS